MPKQIYSYVSLGLRIDLQRWAGDGPVPGKSVSPGSQSPGSLSPVPTFEIFSPRPRSPIFEICVPVPIPGPYPLNIKIPVPVPGPFFFKVSIPIPYISRIQPHE